MMNRFDRSLRWGYGISLLVLLLIGGISWLTLDSLVASDRAVGHSTEVVQKLEQLLSEMKDAETGERGYLLTGKSEYLEPYRGAYRQAHRLQIELADLTRDNAQQQAHMARIKNVLQERLSILQQLVGQKQKGSSVAEADLAKGKAAMDELRRLVGVAEADERALLKTRSAELDRWLTLTPVFILFGLVLAIGITGYSYRQVTADVREKERLRVAVEQRDEETQALNEELTAANEEIMASVEELTAINEELTEARTELLDLNNSLEERVQLRTEEVQALNEELMAGNEELTATNEELYHTQQELERSARLFGLIAQNIPGSALLLIDKEQRLLAAEGELAAQLGYGAPGIAGKHIRDILPQRYDEAGPLYDRMLAGEQYRLERRGFDGGQYQVDFVPLQAPGGEVYAGLVIALDITERKKAEAHSAKLAAIVESSDDAIVGKTLEGIITAWNAGAERMFGHTEQEILGRSVLTLIPEDRQEEEPVIIERIKRGERIERFETRRITREGRLLDVSLTISPIRDNRGEVIGISKIARDISEQKRDEQRKSDFIGMASHELKTPLTSLSALLQVMQLKTGNNPEDFMASALVKANQQVKKMTGMINGFLNVSRFESGKIQLEPSEFDLTALIAEMIGEVQLTVTTHQFLFEGAGEMLIRADREKIGSVISNLLSNAVKYSPKGKLVTISNRLESGQALISVQDEGMGIKAQDIDKLFDRYYRVKTTHTQHIAGFGIGLYLSAEIVQRHGGRIWAESQSGVGSTFYFTLPLSN